MKLTIGGMVFFKYHKLKLLKLLKLLNIEFYCRYIAIFVLSENVFGVKIKNILDFSFIYPNKMQNSLIN
jgi:hypothetical protein